MIFPRLTAVSTLQDAWRRVLAHYPKHRVPAELAQFETRRDHLLGRLSRMLSSQNFIPEPAALISIPKPAKPGEKRDITLVAPEDRIVLTALARLIEPIFEKQFLPRSFAYRKSRGPLDAIRAAEASIRGGFTAAAVADIDQFFDNIDRDKLLARLQRSIYEKPILRLLEIYLQMGRARNAEWVDTGLGIAQGSPLSPLLSNVYLIDFDRFLEALPDCRWVRYADDFLILARTTEDAQTSLARAAAFLDSELRLALNPNPSYTTAQAGIPFLGFTLENGRRLIGPAKLESMRALIAAAFSAHPVQANPLVEQLSETIDGWKRYYGTGHTAGQFSQLEVFLGNQVVRWLYDSLCRRETRVVSPEDRAAWLRLPLLLDDSPERRALWFDGLLKEAVAQLPRAAPKAAPKPREPRRAVAQRKQEFLRRRYSLEEIVITRPGTALGRSGERLIIRQEGERIGEAPLSLVKHVSILTLGVSLSADLLSECAERGIGVQILGPRGRAAVALSAPDNPQMELLVRQSALAASPAGWLLARSFVTGKITNQIRLLRYCAKYENRRASRFHDEAAAAITLMEGVMRDIEAAAPPDSDAIEVLDLARSRLFALEGRAAGFYWNAVAELLAGHALFPGRVRKGARDKVNALLNYGYGILYSRLHPLILRAGLSPYIGFLHKPQPGKSGLLFDLIEEFRAPVVDRVVFALLNRRVDFPISDEGLLPEARATLARAIIRRLQSACRYRSASMPLLKIMETQAKMLAEAVRDGSRYKPFSMPW